MKRLYVLLSSCALLALVAARHGVLAQRDVLRLEKIKDDLYVIYGNGGNTGVYVTPEAALAVDSKYEEDGPEIVKLIRSITDKPIKFLVNTHHHGDHSYGNAGFPDETEIVAHENAKRQMLSTDFLYWRGFRARGLPKRLITDRADLFKGDYKVEVVYYGRGHTNGDVFVFFPRVKAVHCGDMFVHRQIPGVDTQGGGSAKEFIASIEKVAARRDIDIYIPGHGEVVNREKFMDYVQMWRDLHAATAKALKEKKPLDDFLTELKLEAYATWKGGTAALKDRAAILYNELAADVKTKKK